MVRLPGGAFRMGSDRHYPEEAPARQAVVAGFAMDRTPVTNAAFAAFVAATGYVTVAELAPDPADYAAADPVALAPGSIVFRPPARRADLRFWGDWWAFVPGAQWQQPDGPGSLADPAHPVVHIAYADAAAFADWAGKALPSEAEWEFAGRGGLGDAEFAWGDTMAPNGVPMANTWQGAFPFENTLEDGFAGTSPVLHFPPNRFGLHDMVGNVWEWTADRRLPAAAGVPGCCAKDDALRGSVIPHHVIKGGSHLCAPNYCRRYRPAARQFQAIDSGTSHLGFRCVRRGLPSCHGLAPTR